MTKVELENQKIVFKGNRIPYGSVIFAKEPIRVTKLISLDGYYGLDMLVEKKGQSTDMNILNRFCSNYTIVNGDFEITSSSEENFDGDSLAVYGNLTISKNSKFKVLYVKGDLIIDDTVSSLEVVLLLVRGNVIAPKVDLKIHSFCIHGSLTANELATGDYYSNQTKEIIWNNCSLNNLKNIHKCKINSTCIVIKGNFTCNTLDYIGSIINNEPRSFCKIEEIKKIKECEELVLETYDLEVESSISVSTMNCHNLNAHSSVQVQKNIICSGNFNANGNVIAEKIEVNGNYTVTNGITTAEEVQIKGKIFTKQIDTFNLKIYHHYF